MYRLCLLVSVALTFPSFAYANPQCARLVQQKLIDERSGRYPAIEGNGSSVAFAWNQPVSIWTKRDFNYLGQIGTGSTPAFTMYQGAYSRRLYGTHKSIQVVGNNWNQSWSTDSTLEIDPRTGQFSSWNHTWNDGWKIWTDVRCYEHQNGISVTGKLRHFFVNLNLWSVR